jgi:opacity protein-like surface antigen
MRKLVTSFSVAAALAAAASAIPASAADLDAPMIIQDAPLYTPVEVGSGWYLRGDVTYNLDESAYDFTLLGVEAENDRFGGSIGIGYHFSDLFRADLNLAYVSHDEYLYDDGVDVLSAENRVLGAMVNGYLDLGTFVGLTPYVGAGAGLLYSKHEVDVDSPTLGLDYAAADRQFAFAYALNAGVNYQLTRNVSLDVGYQYLSSPGLEYVNVATGAIEDGVDYHQLKVGLRYDLW